MNKLTHTFWAQRSEHKSIQLQNIWGLWTESMPFSLPAHQTWRYGLKRLIFASQSGLSSFYSICYRKQKQVVPVFKITKQIPECFQMKRKYEFIVTAYSSCSYRKVPNKWEEQKVQHSLSRRILQPQKEFWSFIKVRNTNNQYQTLKNMGEWKKRK